jgi:hypothetical protein
VTRIDVNGIAIGIRVRELPLTPERIAAAIARGHDAVPIG